MPGEHDSTAPGPGSPGGAAGSGGGAAGGRPAPGAEGGAPGEADDARFDSLAGVAAGVAAGEDGIDLQAPRRRAQGPLFVLSLFIMVGGAYMAWLFRDHSAYFFQPRAPAELGDAAQAAGDKLRPNRYLRVRGTPDRRRTAVVEGRWGSFQGVFRLLGTRSRLWVAQPRKGRMPPSAFSDVFAGRLARFSSVGFFTELSLWLRDNTTLVREIDPQALARAAGTAPARLRDRAGDEIVLAGDRLVHVHVRYPGDWRLQLDSRRFDSEDKARELLAGLGRPWARAEETGPFRGAIVRAEGDDARALRERFSAPEEKVIVSPRIDLVTARWDRIAAAAGGLSIRETAGPPPDEYRVAPDGTLPASAASVPVAVPIDRIEAIEVEAPLIVPDDALVLLQDETPGSYWAFVLLDAVVVAFVAINAFTLRSRVRRWRAARAGRRA